MQQKTKIILIISIILLLSGCTTIKDKFKSINNPQTEELTCPSAKTTYVQNNSYRPIELGSTIYYFNTQVIGGFKTFLENSVEPRCSIIGVDSQSIAEELNKNQKIKIVFNRQNVMDYNNVPLPTSKYNMLYSNGRFVSVFDDLHYNFCVSEQGLFLFSNYLDDVERYDFGLFIKSPELTQKFNLQFENMKGE